MIFILKYTGNVYSISISISLYFLVIMFFIGGIEKRIDEIKKSEKFLEQSEFILNRITFIFWFTISGFILSVPFIYINLSSAGSNLGDISLIFSIGFACLVMIVAYTKVFRRNLLKISKYLLNKKYLDKFPYIHIKTTTSLDFEGKLCDLFNENLIVLDYNGVKKAAEWHTVNYLECRRAK